MALLATSTCLVVNQVTFAVVNWQLIHGIFDWTFEPLHGWAAAQDYAGLDKAMALRPMERPGTSGQKIENQPLQQRSIFSRRGVCVIKKNRVTHDTGAKLGAFPYKATIFQSSRPQDSSHLHFTCICSCALIFVRIYCPIKLLDYPSFCVLL